MTVLALIALAYFCGSIPTGVWLARRRGVDPRDIGSGNIGATNVARAAGNTAGALTLAGDTLKGLLRLRSRRSSEWVMGRERWSPSPPLRGTCSRVF
jgi:glycerol-3-phosphate acyltransferase PlsY